LFRAKHLTLNALGVIYKVYKKSIKFRIGFTILSMLLIFGFIVSYFAPMDTRDWYVLPRELPPSKDNLLGTTAMGRDVFWELASSVKNSLIIALITALVSVTVSLIIGLMAGLKAGIIDRILMFITDTFIIIPGLPLLIVVAAVLKAWMTLPMLGVLMALIAWPWPARQIRAIVLSLRERTFVYTAMLSGMGSLKILLREIMPYLIGWILVNFTNTILFSIGFESGLAMLGLSILGENTLGVMIYWALNYYALFRGILWWIIPPVVTLILIFISLYLISVGLSDYISPLRGE